MFVVFLRKFSMNRFNPSVLLVPELRVVGADSLLYRIGLSLFKTDSDQNRSLFYNPILICIILLQTLVKNIYLLTQIDTEYSDEYYMYFGDVGHFFNLKVQLELMIALVSVHPLVAQLIHIWNYKHDIKPTDLRLFQMISGLRTPESIGLYDKQLVYKLIKLYRIAMKFCKKNRLMVSIGCFATPLVVTFKRASIIELIFIVVPHCLLWHIWFIYLYNAFVYQLIYYLIIAYYLIFKLKLINKLIKESTLTTIRSYNNIQIAIYELNSIYNEINEYNNNYWSKYLCFLWITIGGIIAIYINVIFMVENIYFKIFFILTLHSLAIMSIFHNIYLL